MTGKTMLGLTKQAASDWSEDNATRLAAALAYYTMLSIAPLLIITIKIVGTVFGEQAAQGQVEAYLRETMGAQGAQAAQDMIASAGERGSGVLATVISSVVLIFSASGVFGALQDSLNTIWEVQPKPDRGIWGMVKDRFFSMALVLGIAFLLIVSLVASTVLTTLFGGADGSWFWSIVHFAGSIVVITGLFAMIFKYLPDAEVAWKDVWLGAVVTAVLFTIGKYLLAWYLGQGSTTSVYGAAGSLVAMLIWVYYSSLILFFGAEFTQAYARSRGSGIKPAENAMKVTDEQRAQQGLDQGARKQTARARGSGTTGSSASSAPAYVERPVPVFVPVADTRGAKAIAAGGVVAGLAVGTLGIFARRLFGPRFEESEVARRLNDAEHELARERGHLRYGGPSVRRRLDEVEHRILDVARQVPPPRRLEKPNAGRINQRLEELEHHFARDRGLDRYAQHVRRQERLDRVEDRIREVVREDRRRTSPLPVWMQKVQEIVTGT